jgi:hypothetical protein
MNNVLKTILFLGLAAALLFMPMTAAADENIQDPPSVALAASSAISLNSRGTAECPVHGMFVAAIAPRPISFHDFGERVAKVAASDGRSTLRSSCLLRC